ncbi:hypothetical protein FJT64_022525 [Amphibalanus amphitrite]|uniref:Uncharacterized protein n=1 Tax=Amphibalanus amphitrite TaxID=1232801 RepID=A0A6A4WGP3_AMPAM|nr:hypothetical protein FJT64_022525 [Amphibalanus amphitrite]
MKDWMKMALLCRRWLGQVALGARSMHAHRLSDNMALLTAYPSVFDSPADMEEIPVGLPMALTDFVPLQRLIASYARLHLRWMEQRATRHYREAKRQVVHYPMPQAATLFLWSQNDPVTSCRAILDLGAAFEASGRQVFYKCWADSQHVRHLLQHPGDYHSEVAEFLRRLGHLRYPDRFPDHQPAARAAIRQ